MATDPDVLASEVADLLELPRLYEYTVTVSGSVEDDTVYAVELFGEGPYEYETGTGESASDVANGLHGEIPDPLKQIIHTEVSGSDLLIGSLDEDDQDPGIDPEVSSVGAGSLSVSSSDQADPEAEENIAKLIKGILLGRRKSSPSVVDLVLGSDDPLSSSWSTVDWDTEVTLDTSDPVTGGDYWSYDDSTGALTAETDIGICKMTASLSALNDSGGNSTIVETRIQVDDGSGWTEVNGSVSSDSAEIDGVAQVLSTAAVDLSSGDQVRVQARGGAGIELLADQCRFLVEAPT